jgi:hypothetical protein
LVSCSAERQDTNQYELNPLAEEIGKGNQHPAVMKDDQVKASATLSEANNLATTSIINSKNVLFGSRYKQLVWV